jgi:hypothetical protein
MAKVPTRRTTKVTTTIKKPSIVEIIVGYLSKTPPGMLFLHLVWIVFATATISSGYIFAFHFTSLVSIYQDAHNIRNFNANLRLGTRQAQEITTNLQSLIETVGSNRAYVFRYHNGLAAVNGVPFFFQTMTHEVISPGTPRLMGFEQHLPASVGIMMSAQFMQNRCGIIEHANTDPDSRNYWYFLSRGATDIVRCPIFAANGDLFGFVGVDFTSDRDLAIDDVTNKVREAATTIGLIFAGNQ